MQAPYLDDAFRPLSDDITVYNRYSLEAIVSPDTLSLCDQRAAKLKSIDRSIVVRLLKTQSNTKRIAAIAIVTTTV